MKLTLICLALLAVSTFAFYDGDSNVVTLTVDNFQTEVLDTEGFWLVEFYAPWCGHCKQLTPEWEKAAKGLKGIVKMGAVDMTTEKEAGKDYNIEGFPTLKWFGEDKSAPIDFEGGRTSSGIINFAVNKLKQIANERLGNKRVPRKEAPKKEEEPKEEEATGDDDVVVLSDDTFAELVEESKEAWFVEFYAPWCGHCKNLTPVWKKLATAYKGKVNIAKVDSTVNRTVSERFGVKGYPSLKWFPAGLKSDSLVVEHEGGRDYDALSTWIETKTALSAPAKFKQLNSQEDYVDYCEQNKGVCLIVFLPSLSESTAEQRNSYISQIEEVANANKGKPFTFLWSEGGKQFEFEEVFQIGGFGYPAVAAVTVSKGKYAILRSSFTGENFGSFVVNIGAGKQSFQSFNKAVKVVTVPEWNGQDLQKNEEL